MLKRYLNPKDCIHVHFSDEVHFDYSIGFNIAYVIRKSNERECPSCMSQDVPPDDKTNNKAHSWAAVGCDFKSPMVFYDDDNDNGKMTHKCYVEQILEPVVRQ